MRWWKLFGLAGVVGVAATGVVTVHAQRQRQSYTPEQVRARLLARHAEAAEPEPPVGRTADLPRVGPDRRCSLTRGRRLWATWVEARRRNGFVGARRYGAARDDTAPRGESAPAAGG